MELRLNEVLSARGDPLGRPHNLHTGDKALGPPSGGGGPGPREGAPE